MSRSFHPPGVERSVGTALRSGAQPGEALTPPRRKEAIAVVLAPAARTAGSMTSRDRALGVYPASPLRRGLPAAE
jgi:hypothetical protein